MILGKVIAVVMPAYNAAVARETKAYKPIPDILDFRDKDGNDTMQAEIEQL